MRFLACLVVALVAMVSSARAAPALEAFAANPRIDKVSLSPSGQRFALIGVEDHQRRLYVRRADGQALYLANLGNTRVRSMDWAGDDFLIVLTEAPVGGAVLEVARQTWASGIVVNLKTATASGVFRDSKTLIPAVFGVFGTAQVQGRWFAYLGGISYEKTTNRGTANTISPDLYRVDLETMAYERIALAGSTLTQWVINGSGEIVGSGRVNAGGKVLTLYAGVGDGQPLLSRPIGRGKLMVDGLGRTQDSLLVADGGAGEEVAREFRPGGPPGGEVLVTATEGAEALRDPVTGLFVGSTDRDAVGGVRMSDPALQRRVTAGAKAFPDSRARLVSFSSGLQTMVMFTEGPQDSGSYWLVDIGKKSAVPIGAARPSITAQDLGPVSLVSYKASDGLPLNGVLTLPLGRAPKALPVIVMPHGGPIAPPDGLDLNLMAQAFASRGYAVFQPNYRGTLGAGEAARRQAEGEVGRKLQTDLSDGVAALAASGVVDPKRACIVGRGYGAYAALAGLTLQHGVYRCAVGWDGIYDLGAYSAYVGAEAAGDVRRLKAKLLPLGPVDGQDLATISPAKHAQEADGPVLLISSEEAEDVRIRQSQLMRQALSRAGKPVEFYLSPDLSKKKPGDPMTDESEAQAMLARAVAFVEKHNPPQ